MKIAIVKLSALGDIIHAIVVLQFIKKNNPEIEIDWVVEESYKSLLEFNPDLNKIHAIKIKKARKEKSLFMLLQELKKVQNFGPYDLVIDMQGLIKSAIIARLIPSTSTLGFEKSSIREHIASIFYTKTFKYGYDENVIERNIALISFALKIDIKDINLQFKKPFLYSLEYLKFDSISDKKPNILLILGASFESKAYPVDGFVEVIKSIDANFLVIWNTKKEKNNANTIKLLVPKVIVLKKLFLNELVSLVNQVDLVIGPDTGPTHMAWASNIPSIILFGPTPGYRNTLLTNINKVIESDSIVNPFKINKNDYSIKNISASDIVKISLSLLKKSS